MEQMSQQFKKNVARYISNFKRVESKDNNNDKDENKDDLFD